MAAVFARLLATLNESQEPGDALVEDGGFEPINDRLAGLARRDEPRPAQETQVVGHRRFAEVERGGEFAGRVVALAEQIEDAAACRIVERAKKIVHGHISIFLQSSKCGKQKKVFLENPRENALAPDGRASEHRLLLT